MNVVVQDNIPAYQAALRKYAGFMNKTPEAALARQSRELTMELYFGFHRVRPNIAGMMSSAVARKFTIGRRAAGTLAKVDPSGVSVAARQKAESMLEGAKSDFFRVTTDADGVPRVRLARVGVRNSSRLLTGGRFGNKFAKSARGLRQLIDPNWSEITGDQLESLRKQHPELRVLNVQALAVAIELAYRARAGRGGTLSLQFLHQIYKRRSSSTVKRGPLIARTRSGVPVGEVEFFTGKDGNLEAVEISGSVPGTAKVDARHNIVSAAIATQTREMEQFVSGKLEKDAKASGLK